ncbi:(4Fe-4S)-binding protein [Aequorivita antarctica]|uniref:Iron-binding zinc finger CDGSH type domain-containing protein n=1 Tax=Aequorivita antarctica TaxID=153266 RepID=A0A5C6YZI8_9FLAO|nr:(4Fe-4S)-binding protein [Aequorivita antarctica]TXD73185.1 hypothetical protein ESU54_08595 [Aequorivita antarctica]SRX74943.1 hypothetical protein AEQU3_01930 [Aequorivita antarctica]
MEKSIKYSNGEVTVVWKPNLCIHSANCVHGLPEVFKPKEKPWIKAENASTEKIIKTIGNCPSGALSYFMNDMENTESPSEKNSENTKVEVLENGPLMVYGSLSLTHDDGREEKKSKVTAFCRCGDSTNRPFCDGSHKQHLWK